MIKKLLAQNARQFEDVIRDFLTENNPLSAQLQEAMNYACLDGGKRFRPFLTKQVAKLFGGDENIALKAALAIEFIHCYSLVHDDLPAMDDDDLRRGKATVHKKYDEATAILTGDALQSLAFMLLSSPDLAVDAQGKLKLINALSNAAGHKGMVLGQMLDIAAEKADSLSLSEVENIQRFKTGALIACAAQFGAIIGQATEEQEQNICNWALLLGEAFQITDDLLDHFGNSQKMGKRLQKDDEKGKVTFVSLLGADGARQRLDDLKLSAEQSLATFGEKADILRQLWDWLIRREH